MKKYVFFCIFSFFIAAILGCRSAAFPFYIDNKNNTMPYFEVPVCDNSGEVFSDETIRIGIDTGSPISFLYKSGIEFLFGSTEEYYSWCKSNNYETDNPEKYVYLNNVYLRFEKNAVSPVFRCCEKDENEFYDGIIGKDFLQNAKTVTFDFRKNVIFINAKKIKTNVLPLKNVEFSDENGHGEYLFIPAEIDGEIYDVMIDTGACSEGIPAIAVAGNFPFGEEVSVKISNEIYEKVKTANMKNGDFDDKNLETHYDSFFANTIIISNAFFKNRRVQLDFERMEFSMD